MKRIALIALVCLLGAAGLRAQVAITGNLKDAGVVNVTAQNTFVRFTLTNFGTNIPRVQPTNVIAVPSRDFKPDAGGNITGVIQGNDTITPTGTFYQVCIYFQGQLFRCQTYLITGGTFNLNTAAPLSSIPIAGPGQLIPFVFPCPVVVPATTWTCTHNFNDPNVYVKTYDMAGNEIRPDHVFVGNPNVATINWVVAQSGYAVILHAGSIAIVTSQPNAVVQNPTGTQSIIGFPLSISSSFNATGGGSLAGTFSGNPTFSGSPIFSNPLTVGSVISAAPSPALTGFLRMANTDLFGWRNAANNADLTLSLIASGSLSQPTNSLNLSAFPTVVATSYGPAATNAALTGTFNLANLGCVSWRNAAASGDLQLCGNASNRLVFNLDPVVTVASTDTLLNKTLTTPTINTPTIVTPVLNGAPTGTGIQGTDTVLLTAGAFTGATGIPVCKSANGGATTVGCGPVVQSARKTSSTCTTGAAINSTCTDTISWPVSFANTTYSIQVTCIDPNVPTENPGVSVLSYTISSVTVTTITNKAATAHCTEIHLTGTHP